MIVGVGSAIPIWDMLGITEEQYQLDYEYKAFVKSEEAITEMVKESFDASMNSFDSKKYRENMVFYSGG
jgi:hypothetical protein